MTSPPFRFGAKIASAATFLLGCFSKGFPLVITKALPPATSDAYKMAIGWSTSGSPVFLLRRRGGTAAVTVDGNGCGFLIVLNVGWVFMVRVSSCSRAPFYLMRGGWHGSVGSWCGCGSGKLVLSWFGRVDTLFLSNA